MSKKVKGIDCLVKIVDDTTERVLAGQRGATLNRSADVMDGTSKDSEGGWKENLQGLKEWGIDCDGALVESDEAFDHLEERYEEGEPVTVVVELKNGKQYKGQAIISDFPIEMPFDDLTTYTITLTGDGKLERIPAV